MTTVQINLPDELAQKAASAGLLSAEAMEAMLREQLRRRAGDTLQAMWQRGPQAELTPELEQEQEVVQEIRETRAERRDCCGTVGHVGFSMRPLLSKLSSTDARLKA